jgi:hypothetical protein
MSFSKKIKYLFEGDSQESPKSHMEVIDENRANEFLKKECSEFEKQQQIFHLINKKDLGPQQAEFYIYDPLKANKPYNHNYSYMFIDTLPSWTDKKYPKRKNAINAFANKSKDKMDVVNYLAIPFNNTKLGISPKQTMVESFNNVSINLGMKFEYFNRSFNIVLNIFNNPEGTYEPDTKKLSIKNEKFFDESFQSLKAAIDKFDADFASDEGRKIIDIMLNDPYNKETEANVLSILNYINSKKTNLNSMINTLFDPSKNAFKFIPFKSFIVGENKQNEVWFNNRCLLVKETSIDKLRFQEHSFNNTPNAKVDGNNEKPTSNDKPLADKESDLNI